MRLPPAGDAARGLNPPGSWVAWPADNHRGKAMWILIIITMSGNVGSVGNFDSRDTCGQAMSVLEQRIATTMEVACVQSTGPVLKGPQGGFSQLFVKK